MARLSAPEHLSEHRILLVNDDGIRSQGIQLLEAMARQFTDDVWVVAPEEEHSGASHAISLTSPLRMRRLDERHFAVKGTPADCVLLAFFELLKDFPPTVVLSGINHGENLAEDMVYSGTAAAAMEGAILGVRAIALSQVFQMGKPPRLETARRFTPGILKPLLSCPWATGHFININFPDVDPDEVSGVRLTRQGWRRPGSFRPLQRIDGRKVPYYWIGIQYEVGVLAPGTDLHAIDERAISVTPMQLDQSAPAFASELESAFSEGAGTSARGGSAVGHQQ
jgi:5'-nucleotidase